VTALTGRRLAVYAFCVAVWGSTWLVIKIGLADLPPFHFAAIRMTLACLLMAPLAFKARARPTRSEVFWIAVSGWLQIGVAYALIFAGEQWIDSGLAAILFCSFPIWVGLFAHWWLPNEPLTSRVALGAVLGLSGVAVIQWPAVAAAFAAKPGPLLYGGLCVLGSAISSAISNVINKRHFAAVSPYQNVWGQTLVGSAFLWLLALALERGTAMRWTPSSILAVAYLTVFGTALAFAGLFWLLPRVPVAVIGTIPLTDTIVAVALGAAVLHETLGPRVLAGAVLILLGVLLTAVTGSGATRSATRPAPGA
jgi:drug/metabolite transporter (DMT)-like permease